LRETGEVVNGVEITEMQEKVRMWGERMTYKLGIKYGAKSGNKVPFREERHAGSHRPQATS